MIVRDPTKEYVYNKKAIAYPWETQDSQAVRQARKKRDRKRKNQKKEKRHMRHT